MSVNISMARPIADSEDPFLPDACARTINNGNQLPLPPTGYFFYT